MDYLDTYFLLTVIFAVLIIFYVYWKGKIDLSAVIASGIVGVLVLFSLGDDWHLIYLILAFFGIGNFITKYGYAIKKKYRVEQEVRSFRNVFGNGGAAVVFSILFLVTNLPVLLLGLVGAMATASADTFATEIGQAHEKNPRLITTLKRVKVGSSGAVSIYGLIAALIGAAVIAAIPLFFGKYWAILPVGTFAGFLGCIADSFIGATIERNRMDTHMTNFIATTVGGLTAILLGNHFGIFI
jgi:uncharacterized protein (TIGR00297 family)